MLIDGLDDALELAYECRPERFYVLNSLTKTISYQSFAVFQKPQALKEFLEKTYLGEVQKVEKKPQIGKMSIKDMLKMAKKK